MDLSSPPVSEVTPAPSSPQEKEKDLYTSVQGIPVQLLQGCVRIQYTPGRSKLVSYPDFLASLNSFLTDMNKGRALEYQLPSNVFYLSVSPSSLKMMLYYPECVHPVEFTRDGRKDRLVPNVVISIQLTPGREAEQWDVDPNHVRYFATHRSLDEFPRQFYDTPTEGWLTTVPFTNIYGTGNMCYGQNGILRTVTLPNLRPLASFYYTLLNSPFNTDLGVNSARGASPEPWFRKLASLAESKKADPSVTFPYHELSILNANARS